MAEIRWTGRALGDLREIFDFIARDSPAAAGALLDRVLHSTERLSRYPQSGRSIPELPQSPYRELLVGNYRVLYRIEGDRVWVMAVVHGRRLLGEL